MFMLGIGAYRFFRFQQEIKNWGQTSFNLVDVHWQFLCYLSFNSCTFRYDFKFNKTFFTCLYSFQTTNHWSGTGCGKRFLKHQHTAGSENTRSLFDNNILLVMSSAVLISSGFRNAVWPHQNICRICLLSLDKSLH